MRHASLFEALAESVTISWQSPPSLVGLRRLDAEPRLRALRQTLLDLVVAESEPDSEAVSDLLAGVVAFMGHSSTHWRPERLLVNGARRRIAKLAQEFIEEHFREVVRIEDLCRVAGVGVRTLQRCFRVSFDLSIREYLKAVRLDEARRALTAAEPSRDTVSTIALNSGFRHFGRFSVDFREQFGISPREMLTRRVRRF